MKLLTLAVAAAVCAAAATAVPAAAAPAAAAGTADLRVGAETYEVQPGDTVWVKVLVDSLGPDTSSEATWTLELPPGIEVSSRAVIRDHCQTSSDGRRVSCRQGMVRPGFHPFVGSFPVWVNDCVIAPGTRLSAPVSVISDNPAEDPDPDNNHAVVQIWT
ncbi:hypothetical protein [Streptomyces sp. S.PB5]|uniref:hypothetical protein n=1 Tax=Streptomyces sp. S.PB5 TaxID=3020844 RepID=UPI0025B11882|nr:hypothetical protein [Streptomyces sp. S.PB5]MDN3027201.1 hypothetical protein [Streptomyces sp. S.PB5]